MEMMHRAIQDTWKVGKIHFGKAQPESIRYCAKYLLESESFMICSKGLGKDYLNDTRKYHETIEKNAVQFNGFPMAIPRYYKEDLQLWQENSTLVHEGKQIEIYPTEYNLNRKPQIVKDWDQIERFERYHEQAKKLIKKGYNDPEAEIEKRIINKHDHLLKNAKQNDKF